jgi:hypothetical protein
VGARMTAQGGGMPGASIWGVKHKDWQVVPTIAGARPVVRGSLRTGALDSGGVRASARSSQKVGGDTPRAGYADSQLPAASVPYRLGCTLPIMRFTSSDTLSSDTSVVRARPARCAWVVVAMCIETKTVQAHRRDA